MTTPYDDIVEEALAFGWVDSQPRSIDQQRSARLLTPRKPGSNWSRLNKQRIERLTAAGLMTTAGRAAVAAAEANGRWTALDQTETLAEPTDLAAALDANPAARGYWDAFPRSARRAILEWIGNAKTGGTRQTRIERTVTDAARNIRANQWRQPKHPAGPNPAAGGTGDTGPRACAGDGQIQRRLDQRVGRRRRLPPGLAQTAIPGGPGVGRDTADRRGGRYGADGDDRRLHGRGVPRSCPAKPGRVITTQP